MAFIYQTTPYLYRKSQGIYIESPKTSKRIQQGYKIGGQNQNQWHLYTNNKCGNWD